MSPAFVDWLLAFVWTIALELPVYGWVMRRFSSLWWAGAATTLAVNLATHPMLWYVAPPLDADSAYFRWLLVMEGCVCLAEATLVAMLLRHRLPLGALLRWALGASIAANLVSTLFGLLLWRIVWA